MHIKSIILENKCPKCGIINTREISSDQFTRLKQDEYIQDIFPEPKYDSNYREFFLTGICNSCWEQIFNEDLCRQLKQNFKTSIMRLG